MKKSIKRLSMLLAVCFLLGSVPLFANAGITRPWSFNKSLEIPTTTEYTEYSTKLNTSSATVLIDSYSDTWHGGSLGAIEFVGQRKSDFAFVTRAVQCQDTSIKTTYIYLDYTSSYPASKQVGQNIRLRLVATHPSVQMYGSGGFNPDDHYI